MMNAVDRHISVSTTSPSSQFEWLGSIQIVRLVDHARGASRIVFR